MLYRYPKSIIWYLVYLFICTSIYIKDKQHENYLLQHPHEPHGVYEFNGILIIAPFAFIFIMITGANAIAVKQNKFYLWLVLLVIIPVAAYASTLNR